MFYIIILFYFIILLCSCNPASIAATLNKPLIEQTADEVIFLQLWFFLQMVNYISISLTLPGESVYEISLPDIRIMAPGYAYTLK